jgi:hypothetical protein
MQTFAPNSIPASVRRTDPPGSIFIAFPQAVQPARRTAKSKPVRRMVSERLDQVLTAAALAGLLSPLVIGMVMFVGGASDLRRPVCTKGRRAETRSPVRRPEHSQSHAPIPSHRRRQRPAIVDRSSGRNSDTAAPSSAGQSVPLAAPVGVQAASPEIAEAEPIREPGGARTLDRV